MKRRSSLLDNVNHPLHVIYVKMHIRNLPKPLRVLTAAYFFASLGHFAHNAEFLCEYPNLPDWLKRAKVYLAWIAITSVGLVGF